jgi:hypothetical protein
MTDCFDSVLTLSQQLPIVNWTFDFLRNNSLDHLKWPSELLSFFLDGFIAFMLSILSIHYQLSRRTLQNSSDWHEMSWKRGIIHMERYTVIQCNTQ